MEGFKSAFGMIRLFVPVVYCGGLLVYFLFISGGSLDIANLIGLTPWMLGFGAIALVFCIPLGLRLVQLFRRRPPDGGDGSDEGFDPDAAIARYMASQRSVSAMPGTPVSRPAPLKSSGHQGGTAKPAGFGRRTK